MEGAAGEPRRISEPPRPAPGHVKRVLTFEAHFQQERHVSRNSTTDGLPPSREPPKATLSTILYQAPTALKVRFFLLLLGASLLGAILGAIATGQVWDRRFEEWRRLAAQGQLYLATEIYRGREKPVVDEIVANTAMYVRELDPSDPDHSPFLWAARDLYVLAGIEPPSDVSALLAAAPPKAEGCCNPTINAIPLRGDQTDARPDKD